MDMDKAQINEILDLTLEIIFVLTGEDYTLVKKASSKGQSPASSISTIKSKQKILEVINKIVERLGKGEVPSCQYVEDHKDLYKEEKMESQDILVSPDGSRIQERCPRPLDSTQEDHEIPQDHSLYSKDSTQEVHTIPQRSRAETLNNEGTSEMKVEGEKEEDHSHQYAEVNMTFKEEGGPAEVSTAGKPYIRKTSEGGLISSPTCDTEDAATTTQDHPGENSSNAGLLIMDTSLDPSPKEPSSDKSYTITPGPGFYTTDRMPNPSCPEGSSNDRPCPDLPDTCEGLHSSAVSVDPSNPEESPVCKPEKDESGPFITQESDPNGDQKTGKDTRSFNCSECGKSFALQNDLIEHQAIHNMNKPYSCSDCGKRFTAKSKLIQHVRVHTGEKPFPCPECGRCFTTKTNLVSHQIIHTDRKPFVCKECGKCFSRQSSLLMHQQTHSGNKDFTCSECGKSFAFKNYLRIHEKIHTGEKPFSCSECGKCFVQRWALVIHERLHRGEKPYSCAECGRSFVDKGQLTIHQRIHTGERPYACTECYMSFVQKSSLMRHQRTHTGERPFSCSQCGKGFSQKAQLVTHQKVHTAI